jgi:hypothetical protein
MLAAAAVWTHVLLWPQAGSGGRNDTQKRFILDQQNSSTVSMQAALFQTTSVLDRCRLPREQNELQRRLITWYNQWFDLRIQAMLSGLAVRPRDTHDRRLGFTVQAKVTQLQLQP